MYNRMRAASPSTVDAAFRREKQRIQQLNNSYDAMMRALATVPGNRRPAERPLCRCHRPSAAGSSTVAAVGVADGIDWRQFH